MDYLIVDMTRVLRETEHGKTAMASMRNLVERTKNQEDAIRTRYDKATGTSKKQIKAQFTDFDTRRREEISRRRDALQHALVALATTAAHAIAAERSIPLVLERSAVLVYDEAADLTDEVIARVNAVELGK